MILLQLVTDDDAPHVDESHVDAPQVEHFEMTSPYVPPQVQKFYDPPYRDTDTVGQTPTVVENKVQRPAEFYDTHYSEPAMSSVDAYASPTEAYSAKQFCDTIQSTNCGENESKEIASSESLEISEENEDTNVDDIGGQSEVNSTKISNESNDDEQKQVLA